MKLKHRKGSTLTLTLMIFAVLMIFATFILNFMVNENKQAMYYQNKTQAYYIARSGAEAVETAIIEKLTADKDDGISLEDKTNLISSIGSLSSPTILSVSGLDLNSNEDLKIELSKTKNLNDEKYIIQIESIAKVGFVNEEAIKIFEVPYEITKLPITLKLTQPITYVENADIGGEVIDEMSDEKIIDILNKADIKSNQKFYNEILTNPELFMEL